jgi:hypothetical protein
MLPLQFLQLWYFTSYSNHNTMNYSELISRIKNNVPLRTHTSQGYPGAKN